MITPGSAQTSAHLATSVSNQAAANSTYRPIYYRLHANGIST